MREERLSGVDQGGIPIDIPAAFVGVDEVSGVHLLTLHVFFHEGIGTIVLGGPH
jgi:hypothetical protein